MSAELTIPELSDAAFSPGTAEEIPRFRERERAGVHETSRVGGKPRKSRGKMIAFAILLVLVLAGLGSWWFVRASRFESTDDAFVEADVHPISSRVSGDVVEVLVEDNQEVTEGQPLLRLDPRDFQVKLDGAQAALSQVIAQIPQADAAFRQAQAEGRKAQSQRATAQAQLEKAEKDFARAQQLVAARITSHQEFDTAKAALDAAKGTYAATVAACDAAEAAIRTAEANRAVTAAKKQQAESSVADAELQLSYTTVLAPASGRVAKKTVETGQRVQPGQSLLAVVAPENWVVANFKESQLAEMRSGQPVDVTIDALGRRHFAGHVDSFAPGTGAKFSLLPPDNATGNFTKIVQRVPVKIRLEATQIRELGARIAPGLSAVASVQVKE